MATVLAERIVSKLIASSAVKEADRELYVYGFFLLITRSFFFLVAVAFGSILGIPCESVIFYIVFILLRSYAGGVHAKTEMACTLWTTLAIGVAVATIKELETSNGEVLLLLIMSNLSFLLFCPLGTTEKPLKVDEMKKYRKICCLLLLICDVVAITSNCLVFPTLYYSVTCGICLEATLLSIGKLCNVLQRRSYA